MRERVRFAVVEISLFGKKRYIRRGVNAVKPFLKLLYLRISRAYQVIGRLFHVSVGVHLIADRAFRAVCYTERFLVSECIRMLETAEFAPRRMEFSRHAEKILAEGA